MMNQNGVWMVEWSCNYSDCNGAFSTRDKAIAYIESEATRMGLRERDFGMVAECEGDDPSWGVYEFQPNSAYNETDVQSVSYQWYPIDA